MRLVSALSRSGSPGSPFPSPLTLGIWSAVLVWGLLIIEVGMIATPPRPRLVGTTLHPGTRKARLQWRVFPASGSHAEYWRADAPDERLLTTRVKGRHTDFCHWLSDLEPGTRYHYRIHLDPDPESGIPAVVSAVGTFTTQAEVRISDLAVEEQLSSLRVSWRTNVPADTVIQWGHSRRYERAMANLDQEDTIEHSILLEGLTPATSYHFRVLSSSSDPSVSLAESPNRIARTAALPLAAVLSPTGQTTQASRSYVEAISHLSTSQRENLLTALHHLTGPMELDAAGRQAALQQATAPLATAFQERLRIFSGWLMTLSKKGRDIHRCLQAPRLVEKLFYVNPVRGAKKLDDLLKMCAAAEMNPQQVLMLDQSLDVSVDLEDIETDIGEWSGPPRNGAVLPATPSLEEKDLEGL